MDKIQTVLENSAILGAIMTPVILAIVQLSKSFISNPKWYPVISVGLGLVSGWLFGGFDTLAYNLLLGLVVGLASAGLYSGVKTISD